MPHQLLQNVAITRTIIVQTFQMQLTTKPVVAITTVKIGVDHEEQQLRIQRFDRL